MSYGAGDEFPAPDFIVASDRRHDPRGDALLSPLPAGLRSWQNVAEMNLWQRMWAAMLVGVRDPIPQKTLGDEALALPDPESLLLLAAVIAVVLYGNAWGASGWAGTLATLVVCTSQAAMSSTSPTTSPASGSAHTTPSPKTTSRRRAVSSPMR